MHLEELSLIIGQPPRPALCFLSTAYVSPLEYVTAGAFFIVTNHFWSTLNMVH
jgi:hypothetical protein